MTERQKLYTIGTLSYTLSTLCTLFFLLLLGDLVWSMKERSVAQIVQLMFKRHGASDMINGLMMVSLPNALGLLLGPVISYKSDHCRSRWGRRIPYLLFTTPIAAGAMAGMAFSPAIGETLAASLSWSADSVTLCFLGFFWALFEFATVIAGALFGALINDVVPHRFLGRFYGLFRIISLLVGIGFNYYLFGFAEVHYRILFLTIGALYLAGFLIMCLNVKEGEYPVQETEKRKSSLAAIRSYFRECFSNPYYLLVFLMLFFAVMTFAPVNSFCMFYAQSMDIPMKSYGRFLAVTYFFSLVFAYGLGALADRFHPLRIGLAMLALYGALGVIAFFWIHDEFSFGISFIAHGVIAGSYFTATASLTQRLYPQESFAQFSSAGGLLCGLGLTLLMPMAGRFLDWIGHQYQYDSRRDRHGLLRLVRREGLPGESQLSRPAVRRAEQRGPRALPVWRKLVVAQYGEHDPLRYRHRGADLFPRRADGGRYCPPKGHRRRFGRCRYRLLCGRRHAGCGQRLADQLAGDGESRCRRRGGLSLRFLLCRRLLVRGVDHLVPPAAAQLGPSQGRILRREVSN